MRDFNQLKIWQKSHYLTLKVYSITQQFPKQELYGLSSQMRRSSSSIPTNIAEGCGRGSQAEFRQFLIISSGSGSELQYQLILAKDLNYITDSIFRELTFELTEIRRMLTKFIQTIK